MSKCTTCRNGDLEPGFTTVTLTKGDHVFLFKQVPANICDTCGDYTLSMEVAEVLLNQANHAENRGAELEIQQYKMAG